MLVVEPAREPGCVSYSPIHMMPLQLVESGTLPPQAFRMAMLEASSIMLASDQPAPRAWHAARAAGQVDSPVCPAYTGAVGIGEDEGESVADDVAVELAALLADGERVFEAVAAAEEDGEADGVGDFVAINRDADADAEPEIKRLMLTQQPALSPQ